MIAKTKLTFKRNSIVLSSIFLLTLLMVSNFASAGGIPAPSIVIYGKITNGASLIASGEVQVTYYNTAKGISVTAKQKLSSLISPEPEKIEYSYKIKIPVEYSYDGYTPSSQTLQISDTPITYIRTVTVKTGDKIKTYTDTVTLQTSEQYGTSERRDYNLKTYSPEEIKAILLGYLIINEKVDPNGDQILDISDLIYAVKEKQ